MTEKSKPRSFASLAIEQLEKSGASDAPGRDSAPPSASPTKRPAPLSTAEAPVRQERAATPALSGTTEIKTSREGMEDLRWVPTAAISVCAFHDRRYFDGIEELAESMANRQQQQPAVVRAAGTGRFELICGARRFEAAKINGEPLLCFVRALTDAEAFSAMVKENSERANLSAIEEALSLQRALDSGLFASQAQLALKINMARQTLNDKLKPAKLPKEVLGAMRFPQRFDWQAACVMVELVKEGRAADLIKAIPELEARGRVTAQRVRDAVDAARTGEPVGKRRKSARVVNATGIEVARVRGGRNGTRVLIIGKHVDDAAFEGLLHLLRKVPSKT